MAKETITPGDLRELAKVLAEVAITQGADHEDTYTAVDAIAPVIKKVKQAQAEPKKND